jgi:hypothetical protein
MYVQTRQHNNATRQNAKAKMIKKFDEKYLPPNVEMSCANGTKVKIQIHNHQDGGSSVIFHTQVQPRIFVGYWVNTACQRPASIQANYRRAPAESRSL